MRHTLAKAVIGSALLFSGVAANAQVYGRGYYDRGRVYGEFERYPDDRYGRDGLFDRVRSDLDRAESYSDRYNQGGDNRRFNKAREELGEFQSKWARGRFDRHGLDDVIKALQRVINDNRLDHRDRDALQADLYQLRDFRANN